MHTQVLPSVGGTSSWRRDPCWVPSTPCSTAGASVGPTVPCWGKAVADGDAAHVRATTTGGAVKPVGWFVVVAAGRETESGRGWWTSSSAADRGRWWWGSGPATGWGQ